MSTADDEMTPAEAAWAEWDTCEMDDTHRFAKAAFMAGYRRALEDAAENIPPSIALGMFSIERSCRYDDEAPHVHQWRTFRPYNQPAYQSCAGCGNVIPAPKDDR